MLRELTFCQGWSRGVCRTGSWRHRDVVLGFRRGHDAATARSMGADAVYSTGGET